MKKLNIFVLLMCLFVPLALSGCKNSNKETLSTPAILEIKAGTVVFNSVADAEYYTLSINDYQVKIDAAHNSNVQIINNQINYDASKIFVVGNSYAVKIQANSNTKNSSSFSQATPYLHSGTVKKPTNVKINSTTLTWDAVENASYYLVKLITPNDKVVFDKNGNVLTQTDPVSIDNADLPEYSFNTNQFDFGSLLTKAGNYQFYVCAVLSDGSTYLESGYSSNITYTHLVTLDVPTNGQIYCIDNKLHLVTVVDVNANALTISCNGTVETLPLTHSSITAINKNYLDVCLNDFFAKQIENQELSFDQNKQFTFATKSIYQSPTLENAYYTNSGFSNAVVFDNQHQIATPEISLQQNTNGSNELIWNCSEESLVSAYKVLVFTATELKEYKLDKDIFSMLITDDFVALSVQAVGSGNNLSSLISAPSGNPKNSISLSRLNISRDGTTISWNNVGASYYLVEFNNKYITTTDCYFEFDSNEIGYRNCRIKVIAIADNKIFREETFTFDYTQQLSTPIIGSTQGFNSSKLYELTFTKVDNAIGYYVHIKSKADDEFYQIPTLYTSNAIDLSQYIISEGEFTDYEVKVQAVADSHSVFSNSELSRTVNVSHVKVLETPEFYKVNGSIVPVIKQTYSGTTKYILKFYGVDDAGSYEILINYNKRTVYATEQNGLYEIDISSYLISANNYEIKLRAIPSETSFNISASEYAVSTYALTKQLSSVNNIKVTENDGIYTLSFDPVNNAESYRVRIVKENDSSYLDYLNNKGLSNNIEITQSFDISNYIEPKGVYYFYMTALAPKENSYYADANESSSFGYVSKLQSLMSPTNLDFNNLSEHNYTFSWDGDPSADYYLIRITSPNGISYEFKSYATSTNINEYITIQGNYDIAIYSMVNAIGDNSIEYSSSSATRTNLPYTYEYTHDFLRYSVYMYGSEYDFAIDNVQALKNLLWYHYLYEIDQATGLTLLINLQLKEVDGDASGSSSTRENIRDATLRLATEATNLGLYNFAGDENWNKGGDSNNELFAYLCKKLLSIYPEFNVLDSFSLEAVNGSNIFNIKYYNALNQEKILDETTSKYTNADYGNKYTYINPYARKSATGSFSIDSRSEMFVTTTEQLLQAVQHNKKPRFVGNSSVAENVYANAKLVLSAIVTNNMTDLEKVTAIFDWLESQFDLTYYDIEGQNKISGSVEQEDLLSYGIFKQYYLEGIFEDISMLENGDIVVGSNFATSHSYSKAFALLCAIEGINSVVVNGSYAHSSGKTADHAWNKVYLNTSKEQNASDWAWYNVDLTFSDNRIFFGGFNLGYGISSHSHFLVSDEFMNNTIMANMVSEKLTFDDDSKIISSSYQTSKMSKTNYNYYQNSSFGLTSEQILSTITPHVLGNSKDVTTPNNFNYSRQYYNDNDEYKNFYQTYPATAGFGEAQSFLINTFIYAEYMADQNDAVETVKDGTTRKVKRSVFEFSYDTTHVATGTFQANDLTSTLYSSSIPSTYKLDIELASDSTSVGSVSIYTVQQSGTDIISVIYIVEKYV